MLSSCLFVGPRQKHSTCLVVRIGQQVLLQERDYSRIVVLEILGGKPHSRLLISPLPTTLTFEGPDFINKPLGTFRIGHILLAQQEPSLDRDIVRQLLRQVSKHRIRLLFLIPRSIEPRNQQAQSAMRSRIGDAPKGLFDNLFTLLTIALAIQQYRNIARQFGGIRETLYCLVQPQYCLVHLAANCQQFGLGDGNLSLGQTGLFQLRQQVLGFRKILTLQCKLQLHALDRGSSLASLLQDGQSLFYVPPSPTGSLYASRSIGPQQLYLSLDVEQRSVCILGREFHCRRSVL